MIFFTSDLHLGHANILRYDNRPFSCIQEHDEMLISRWNEAVGQKDEVRLLGDVSWHGPKKTAALLARLNGRIHLVLGNHDKVLTRPEVRERFESISMLDGITVRVDNKKQYIVLCHYAMRVWNRSHHGSWHLYGHSHCGLEPHGMSFDVGICCHDYRPLSLDEVARKMKRRASEIERKVYGGK